MLLLVQKKDRATFSPFPDRIGLFTSPPGCFSLFPPPGQVAARLFRVFLADLNCCLSAPCGPEGKGKVALYHAGPFSRMVVMYGYAIFFF